MQNLTFALIACTLGLSNIIAAPDDPAQPKKTPLTRLELKQALEDLKDRTPVIPLPELTEEGRAKLGERAGSYEARLRLHYLPLSDEEWFGQFLFSREPDPNLSLTYEFKTMLFWIVSRTTNCHY